MIRSLSAEKEAKSISGLDNYKFFVTTLWDRSSTVKLGTIHFFFFFICKQLKGTGKFSYRHCFVMKSPW